MKRITTYKHPTSYNEIVAHANAVHARRLAQLKKAEKHIRAIERDLTLVAEGGIYIAVDKYSMRLEDCRAPGEYHYNGRAKWALRIHAGIFSETADRAVRAFLALGWIVERIDTTPHRASLLLRRTKTQSRLLLDCSMELAQSLQPQEAE
ncbi:ACP synthase [Burkholderia pseudomallei]|uniref:ACP synthase n=1 Tax=Burkholderia pseudomallei TaxID=28450 RepID=UPI00132C7480|nr:ACP synthase [Burkholderia pseudomallei]MBF3721595.1 ACP synthase [Burkholderia pseudomallei]MWA16905.1 ACP synthase [Burkholderia pseudomallei]CAJ9628813.1 putative holo-[acyl-carrier-protein] synthase [Burkholderia pseudomallei]